MTDAALAVRIDETFELITRLPPAPAATDAIGEHLSALFETLRGAERSLERAEAEDIVWALWCAHEEQEAAEDMQRAIGAIARRELDDAERLLDRLVERWPDWAEAWNKRATVYFLQGRDAESVADIQRTLTLEPRHFGAVSGLAQICLRSGDCGSALVAFEHALRLNPNLADVREAAEALSARSARTVH